MSENNEILNVEIQQNSVDTNPTKVTDKLKNNEFTSKIKAKTTKSDFKPILSYLFFIALRTSRKISNYILSVVHLILFLLILVIPRIMLDANAFYGNALSIINQYILATKGCLIASIIVNSLFSAILALKLTFSIFASNKEDGTEILIISKPITRNQIFLTRVIFLISIFVGYSIVVLIFSGIGIGVIGPKYFDSGLINPNINATIAVFSFLGGTFLALIGFGAITLLFSTFMGSRGTQAVSSLILFASISSTCVIDSQNFIPVILSENQLIKQYNNQGNINPEWEKYQKVNAIVNNALTTNPEFQTFLNSLSLNNISVTDAININGGSSGEQQKPFQITSPFSFLGFQFSSNNRYSGETINPLSYFQSWTMFLKANTDLQTNSNSGQTQKFIIGIQYKNLKDPSQQINYNNIALSTFYGVTSSYYSPDNQINDYLSSQTIDNALFSNNVNNSAMSDFSKVALPIINSEIVKSQKNLNVGFDQTGFATLSYLLPTSAACILNGISNYNNLINLDYINDSTIKYDIYHKYYLSEKQAPTIVNFFKGQINNQNYYNPTQPQYQYSIQLSNSNIQNIDSIDVMPQYAPFILWLFINSGILVLAWFLYRRKDFQ